MAAALGTAAALAWAPPALAGTTTSGVELDPIGTFDTPTYIDDAPGFPNLLFVTERAGIVEALDDEVPAAKPFLDISHRVNTAGEGGLLSIAFPPDYADSRRFYVYYVNNDSPNGSIEVDEFKRKGSNPMRADPDSRRRVITIPHPDANNHYGGTVRFGPGGRLFLATGDGGGGGDQFHNAFDKTKPLGKLLRINPIPKNPNHPGPASPSRTRTSGRQASTRSGPTACATPSGSRSTTSCRRSRSAMSARDRERRWTSSLSLTRVVRTSGGHSSRQTFPTTPNRATGAPPPRARRCSRTTTRWKGPPPSPAG